MVSLAGLATISGACADTPEPDVDPTTPQTCKAITLYRSDTAFNICCSSPTSRTFYINGESFTDNTNTTKVFIDDTWTTLTNAQFLSEDLVNYRQFNGTHL